MGERYMTLNEIRAQYLNEWVLLVDMKVGRNQEVYGGRVLFHHPDADPVHERVRSLSSGVEVGVFYSPCPAEGELYAISPFFDEFYEDDIPMPVEDDTAADATRTDPQ